MQDGCGWPCERYNGHLFWIYQKGSNLQGGRGRPFGHYSGRFFGIYWKGSDLGGGRGRSRGHYSGCFFWIYWKGSNLLNDYYDFTLPLDDRGYQFKLNDYQGFAPLGQPQLDPLWFNPTKAIYNTASSEYQICIYTTSMKKQRTKRNLQIENVVFN